MWGQIFKPGGRIFTKIYRKILESVGNTVHEQYLKEEEGKIGVKAVKEQYSRRGHFRQDPVRLRGTRTIWGQYSGLSSGVAIRGCHMGLSLELSSGFVSWVVT
jgi:hypothetical protein